MRGRFSLRLVHHRHGIVVVVYWSDSVLLAIASTVHIHNPFSLPLPQQRQPPAVLTSRCIRVRVLSCPFRLAQAYFDLSVPSPQYQHSAHAGFGGPCEAATGERQRTGAYGHGGQCRCGRGRSSSFYYPVNSIGWRRLIVSSGQDMRPWLMRLTSLKRHICAALEKSECSSSDSVLYHLRFEIIHSVVLTLCCVVNLSVLDLSFGRHPQTTIY